MPNYAEWEEKCFVKVQNYRELVLNEAGEIVEAPHAQEKLASVAADKKSAAGRGS